MARGAWATLGGRRGATRGEDPLLACALALACACACADEAHIRLLEPVTPVSSAGASSPAPDAGRDAGPVRDAGAEAGTAPPDAGSDAADAADAAAGADADADAQPDTGADSASPDAAVPSVGLMLRYDFAGTGSRVIDRIGSEDAMLMGGAMLDGQGGVVLDGQDDFVDMPNGLVSRLESMTVMAWLEWFGGVCWQRVFDFGVSDAGEDQVGDAVTALFMTPLSCTRNGQPGVVMVSAEFSGTTYDVFDDAALPQDQPVQVALSVDPEQSNMTVYVDGTRVAQGRAPFLLSDIMDRNNWLGRSQWVQDRFMSARYDEFRIYDRALSESEVAALFERGADQP